MFALRTWHIVERMESVRQSLTTRTHIIEKLNLNRMRLMVHCRTVFVMMDFMETGVVILCHRVMAVRVWMEGLLYVVEVVCSWVHVCVCCACIVTVLKLMTWFGASVLEVGRGLSVIVRWVVVCRCWWSSWLSVLCADCSIPCVYGSVDEHCTSCICHGNWTGNSCSGCHDNLV